MALWTLCTDTIEETMNLTLEKLAECICVTGASLLRAQPAIQKPAL